MNRRPLPGNSAWPFLRVSLRPLQNFVIPERGPQTRSLAFFVYKLVKDKNLILAAVACTVVLIAPLPSLPLNQAGIQLFHYRFTSINPQTFSWSYYWGWVCGQAHILQPVFLVGAMYFGTIKKPWLSALMFAFGSFDPRFSLLALPLIAWYNRKTISAFIVGTIIFFLITNLPFFLYYGIGLHSCVQQ
ncbi:hypothetical protein MUP77_04750 [Candidatus Bathyarchaeota archaeon]|nr:hypothetical protein [Candidatus Bathyarchaeota archaeon]